MEQAATPVPAPERDALNTPYWDNLAQGQLSYQHCNVCGHAWLPARSECPGCLAADWRWTAAAGGAKGRGEFVGQVGFQDAEGEVWGFFRRK